MSRPGRFAVGHPFNPVYLLPLVEVCGGERTDPETLERAAAVYRSVGMEPLVLRAEIDGFVADRLIEAMWREALWLVADDVATVDRDRRRDPARRRPALVVHGLVPDLPRRRRRRGDAPLRRAVRAGAPVAVDEADRRPRALRRARREARGPVRRPGRGPLGARAGAAARRLPRLACSRACAPTATAPAPSSSGTSASSSRRPRRPRTPRSTPRGRSSCTRRRSRRSGSTTTATPTRAATCRCSATRPTRSWACSGSTPPTSTASAATSPSRRTSRTCARPRPATGCARRRRCWAATRSGCTSSTRCSDGDELVATAEQMMLHVVGGDGAGRAGR